MWIRLSHRLPRIHFCLLLPVLTGFLRLPNAIETGLCSTNRVKSEYLQQRHWQEICLLWLMHFLK